MKDKRFLIVVIMLIAVTVISIVAITSLKKENQTLKEEFKTQSSEIFTLRNDLSKKDRMLDIIFEEAGISVDGHGNLTYISTKVALPELEPVTLNESIQVILDAYVVGDQAISDLNGRAYDISDEWLQNNGDFSHFEDWEPVTIVTRDNKILAIIRDASRIDWSENKG